MARLNIERQGRLEPERIAHAVRRIEQLGYTITLRDNKKIQFICKPDSFLCPHRFPKDEDCGIVFLDSFGYWFPDRLNQLTLVSKGGQQ